MIPIILAGGSGCRLWPLSRDNYPKQFLKLCSEKTMLQETILRLAGLCDQAPLLICNEEHRFIAAEQLRQLAIHDGQILLEPVSRNTAPAVAIAALLCSQQAVDPLLLVLPSDHLINDVQSFQQTITSAIEIANQGKLVTFGIVPSVAETGYGYIRRGKPIGDAKVTAFNVEAFIEKPAIELATAFVGSGDYYWNSGIFLFRASCYLAELKRHQPDVYRACQNAIAETHLDLDFIRVSVEAYVACPEISIDHAVMEKTLESVVIPFNANWSDVGNFASLWQITPKDDENNALQGDIFCHKAQNNFIRSDEKLVVALGVKDLLIIDTPDALLVADKNQAQAVRHIVEHLKACNRAEVGTSVRMHRPWGRYELVDRGENFLVKRLIVIPGGKLSLQQHRHRAEHWVVVTGTATVSLDGEQRILTANQSIYIPISAIHSLANETDIPLELIEVQTGHHLSEDDILRFVDCYGRA